MPSQATRFPAVYPDVLDCSHFFRIRALAARHRQGDDDGLGSVPIVARDRCGRLANRGTPAVSRGRIPPLPGQDEPDPRINSPNRLHTTHRDKCDRSNLNTKEDTVKTVEPDWTRSTRPPPST